MADHSSAGAPARDDKTAVLATFATLRQALNAGEADSFVDNLTDDFMLLDMAPGGTPPVGRAAYHERLKGLLSGATLTWDNCVTDEVVVAGSLAFHRYTGVLWIKPKQGGQAKRNERRYIDVFRREPSGRWRLWQHVFTAHTPGR
jgi:predicted transcriptional regulator YdeE/ketosteroid isomerase-like protein